MTLTLTELETDEQLYTVAELLKLDLPETDEEGNQLEYELVKGEIMAKQAGPGGEHGEIVSKLDHELRLYAGKGTDESRQGRIFVACSCDLTPESNVIPDLAFVKKNRFPVRFTGPIPVAPDLIAEVNSPTDTLRKMRTKIQAYQEAGVRMVWSICMEDQFVLVYNFVNATRRFLDLTDELDGGEVVPGFKLPVARLFE